MTMGGKQQTTHVTATSGSHVMTSSFMTAPIHTMCSILAHRGNSIVQSIPDCPRCADQNSVVSQCPEVVDACNCLFYQPPDYLHCEPRLTTAAGETTTNQITTTEEPKWPPTCPEWNNGFMDQFFESCFVHNLDATNNPCNCHEWITCTDHRIHTCPSVDKPLIFNPCTQRWGGEFFSHIFLPFLLSVANFKVML